MATDEGGSPASAGRREPRLESAVAADVPAIKSMVDAAYSKYIERLGKRPAPMNADYGRLVDAGGMHVLRAEAVVVGAILMQPDGDALAISNLVVDPSAQGRGYGRLLMNHAEDVARARGLSAVTLYTNEKMHENIALYARSGFVETGRETQDGYDRVFFRKSLA